MVGEEVVEFNSEANTLQEGAGEIGPLTPKGNFKGRPHPNPILTTRKVVGADTPIGHGLSNVNECILARPAYEPQAWATHPLQAPATKLAWQADRLAALSGAPSCSA